MTTFQIVCVVGAVVFVFGFGLFIKYGTLWLQGRVAGAPVSILQLIGMSLRQVPSRLIVENYIILIKAGIDDVPVTSLEAQFLAGGHVDKVVLALVTANHCSDLELKFETACAIDLAGQEDVFEVVRLAIHPERISVPDPFSGNELIEASDVNGEAICIRAHISITKCIERAIGGGDKTMVLRRLGESILAAVATRKVMDVVANPEQVAREVEGLHLDEGTAFTILSVEISAKKT